MWKKQKTPTPLPWHWENGPSVDINDDYIAILGPDSHGSPHIGVFNDEHQGGDLEENADFIVMACNSYDELYNTLSEAYYFMEHEVISGDCLLMMQKIEDVLHSAGGYE